VEKYPWRRSTGTLRPGGKCPLSSSVTIRIEWMYSDINWTLHREVMYSTGPECGFGIEMGMGMGKSGIQWVPWDSHGNGNKISHGMGMGWE